MKPSKTKVILLTLLVFTLLFTCSGMTSGQELSGGAKIVGTSPFVFAEAQFWVLAVEVGAGLSFTDTANSGEETNPVDFSLAGKLYPVKIMNFSPYLGLSTHYSSNGLWKQSRTFGGVEFDFPGQGVPLSVFAGGGLAFTEAESAGFGWHLGFKYTFSF
ncbi:MAG: hypothetical protein ABEJ25_07155 [Candidatus Bipolaricaulia bacterium]